MRSVSVNVAWQGDGALRAKSKTGELPTRKASPQPKRRRHPLPTAEHRQEYQAQQCLKRMLPTFPTPRIRNLAQ